jgi:endonuclease-3
MAPSRSKLVDDATLSRQRTRLERVIPEPVCALHHRNAYELLVATILSAQCTDKLVNEVTPALFQSYPDPESLSRASPAEIEQLVGRVSFFRTKARNLVATAKILRDEHGGEVPQTMLQLTALPGVARKTANVVLGTAFGIPSGIVVDTHVERVANRLGFVQAQGAVKVERALMERIPKRSWIRFAHQLILFGRTVCQAKRPQCEVCKLAPDCPSAQIG